MQSFWVDFVYEPQADLGFTWGLSNREEGRRGAASGNGRGRPVASYRRSYSSSAFIDKDGGDEMPVTSPGMIKAAAALEAMLEEEEAPETGLKAA